MAILSPGFLKNCPVLTGKKRFHYFQAERKHDREIHQQEPAQAKSAEAFEKAARQYNSILVPSRALRSGFCIATLGLTDAPGRRSRFHGQTPAMKTLPLPVI